MVDTVIFEIFLGFASFALFGLGVESLSLACSILTVRTDDAVKG